MIPPRSFVSSVYCASPGAIRSRSFESRPWSSSFARGPSTSISPMCETSKTPAVRADGAVLRDDALVLHRHLPAGERDQPRAERDVPVVERRAQQRLHAEPILVNGASADRAPERRRSGMSRSGGPGRTGRRSTRRPVRGQRPSIYRARAGRRNLAGSVVAQERRHVEDVVRDLEALAGTREAPATIGASSRRRRRRAARPKPVAITVTRTSSPIASSMTAPKMTFAFWSAAPVTTSAASFTSKRPMSGPPVTLSRIPVAPSIDASSSGDETAVRAASAARFSPRGDADAHQRRARRRA